MSQQRSSVGASRRACAGGESAAEANRRSRPAATSTAPACASRRRRLLTDEFMERLNSYLADCDQRRELAAARAAHDDLRAEGLARNLVATLFGDPEQQSLKRQLAKFGDAHSHGRQWRTDAPRDRNIIEPRDRHVTGYRDTAFVQGEYATERHHVIGGEYGVRPVGHGQQQMSGSVAGLLAEVTAQDLRTRVRD